MVKPPQDEARLDQSGLADGSDVMALVVPEDETKNYMPPGRLGSLAGLGFQGDPKAPPRSLAHIYIYIYIDLRN